MSKNVRILESMKRLAIAKEVIELGARPAIAAIMADIDPGQAIALYFEIHGVRPPRGMLPSSPEWYFQNNQRIIASSAFMSIYNRIVNNAEKASVSEFIGAYRLFKKVSNGDNLGLDIGRAWVLMRLVKAGLIKEKSCRRCESFTITPNNVIFNGDDCQVCKTFRIT